MSTSSLRVWGLRAVYWSKGSEYFIDLSSATTASPPVPVFLTAAPTFFGGGAMSWTSDEYFQLARLATGPITYAHFNAAGLESIKSVPTTIGGQLLAPMQSAVLPSSHARTLSVPALWFNFATPQLVEWPAGRERGTALHRFLPRLHESCATHSANPSAIQILERVQATRAVARESARRRCLADARRLHLVSGRPAHRDTGERQSPT